MNQEYLRWLENVDDEAVKAELESVRGDDAQIEDRFYSELTFGTGGLRGVIGAGTNRMNIYTVGRATQGYAVYLKERYGEASVAISHDNRKNSDVFARAAAAIMAGNGIKVYMYSELMPTPMLSWATRVHKCQGGIMVTASHNPAIYNGYKAYGPDGCQLTDDDAHAVEKAIAGQDYFDGIKKADFAEALASGMINYIDQKVIDDFLAMVSKLAPGDEKEAAALKVVYTPLNGTGRMPVTRILAMNGFSDVTVVPEQEMPDPEFTTCRYPNPEFKEALELGLKLMAEKKADLLLATDPDCDRVGTAVWDNGVQRLITGNEMGVLMMDYLCSKRKTEGTMPKDPVAVKTIVTTDMARRCAEYYGVEMRDVLTGFKYIGEQIAHLEAEGHPERYIMGFEESYGYLTGTDVRDKDAVNASLVICRMTAHYKALGMTLADALRDAEKRFGAFRNALENHAFAGQEGMIKMSGMMSALRENPPMEVMGLKLKRLQDYQQKVDTDFAAGTKTAITLPTSNVLKFYYGDKVTAVVRPSGTEPKLKIYHAVRGDSPAEAEELLKNWQEAFGKITEKLKA
ncbi:MAG: phospho-sugar mutase [Clostridia bacterium]|nr:phospho-sugar mutase [Clostridia bacterium]